MVHRQENHHSAGRSQDSLDDAEKGLYDSSVESIAPPPFVYLDEKRDSKIDLRESSPASPVHQGITPLSSVPELSLSFPSQRRAADASRLGSTVKKPATTKPKISRWIIFDLWFNTYRKFFTFVTLLNLVGIILTAVGKFRYAENHMGALVLGNLLCAILMRNELWMRFLYLVCIYGLRGVCVFPFWRILSCRLTRSPVGTSSSPTSSDIHSATCRRNPLWMRTLRRSMACVQNRRYRPVSSCAAQGCDCQRHHHQCLHHHLRSERFSLGPEHIS